MPQPDGPKQREELALVDVEADIVDRVDVAVLLDDVLDLDERLGVRVLPGLDPRPLVGAQPGRGGGWAGQPSSALHAHCPRLLRLAQLPVTSLVQSRVTVRCVRWSNGLTVNRFCLTSAVGNRLGSDFTSSSISGKDAVTALG